MNEMVGEMKEETEGVRGLFFKWEGRWISVRGRESAILSSFAAMMSGDARLVSVQHVGLVLEVEPEIARYLCTEVFLIGNHGVILWCSRCMDQAASGMLEHAIDRGQICKWHAPRFHTSDRSTKLGSRFMIFD